MKSPYNNEKPQDACLSSAAGFSHGNFGLKSEPKLFIPVPMDAIALLDGAGWAHRFNILIEEREWQHRGASWQRTSPTLEARIRSDLRECAPLSGGTWELTPRMMAMQSIWGEVTATLDAHPGQIFQPIQYEAWDQAVIGSALSRNILPWFDLMQRRTNPAADVVWQPAATVLTGTRLMPPGMVHYEPDLFHIIPLELAGNRRADRIKYHGRNKKVLVYTTDDTNLTQELLPWPWLGLCQAHYWANREPYHQFAGIEEKEVKAERVISDWAANVAERIVSECQPGKSINEYLDLLECVMDPSGAMTWTRAGVGKVMLNEIAYCLKEWHGWENRKSGKARLSRWYAPTSGGEK